MKTEVPLISVCIPLFQTEMFLAQCLESVAIQKFNGSLEVLVLSDASHGRDVQGRTAKKIVNEFSHILNIRYLENSQNLALIETRRRLVNEARGDFIFMLDSDDFLPQGALEVLYDAAVKNDADIVQGDCVTLDVDGKRHVDSINEIHPYLGLLEGRDIFDECFCTNKCRPVITAKLIRKEVYQKAFEEIPYIRGHMAEEVIQYFFLALFSRKYVGIDVPVYNYRIGVGITGKKISTVEDWRKVCSTASVITALYGWVEKSANIEGKNLLDEKEMAALQKLAKAYCLNNVSQLRNYVVPELYEKARSMLCDYWGEEAVQNTEAFLDRKNSVSLTETYSEKYNNKTLLSRGLSSMKKLSFLGIIFFSIFLFSCGGITEINEGSISFDAGQLARSLGSKLEPLSGNNRNANVQEIEYTMTISLSTSGDYVTSAKKDYKKNLSSILTKDEFENAIEDFYKEATGTPITLDNIPVGSRIKVKVSLTLGTADNQKTTEGESDDFLVQGCENRVTIKVKRPALDSGNDNGSSSGGEEGEESGTGSSDGQEEGSSEGEGGESNEGGDAGQGDAGGGNEGGQGQEGQGEGQEGQQQAEETTIDIILYNRIDPGEDPNVTEANYALYKFSEDVYTKDTVQTPKNAYSQGAAFSDFVVGADNKVYFTDGNKIYCDGAEIATINLGSSYSPESYPAKIAYDDIGVIFYMDDNDYAFSLGAYDIENDISIDEEETGPYSHYDITGLTDSVLRFAVSLDYDSESREDDKITKIYKGFIFLSCGTFGQYPSKVFIKIPMTYNRITYLNESKEVSVVLDEEDAEFFNIIDFNPELKSFDITDMTVQDGVLYVLLNKSSIETSAEFQKDLEVRFCGVLLSVSVANFTKTDCRVVAESEISSDESVINFLSFGGPYYGKFYQPQNDFFCPQKFVARKPKKLVMSEDGIFFYKEGDEYKYRNINRIREYDIEHDTFEAYTLKTDTLINFDIETEGDLEFMYNTGTATPDWHTAATFTEVQ